MEEETDENSKSSEIAKKYGGGGHKGSAGFYLPLDSKLPWKKV